MNEYNLKPCPDCGSGVDLGIALIHLKSNEFINGYYVYCSCCEHSSDTIYEDKSQAVEAWNRGWNEEDEES